MARVFEVEVAIPEGMNPATNAPYKAGDTFVIQVEEPTRETKPRGQLWGIELKDMSDDQLKREIINAGSVLYKAKQRGAEQAIIDANQKRLDDAKAEKEKRNPVPQGAVVTATATATPAATEEKPAEDTKPAEDKPAAPEKGKGSKNSAMDNKTDSKLAGEI